MKRKRTAKNADETAKPQKPQRNDQIYQKVLNANGERVRGLWTRFGVYYAQLNANDGKQYRYRLEHADTVPQAVLAQQALKMKQRAGTLLPPSQVEEEKEGTSTDPKEGTTDTPPESRSLSPVIERYQKDRDTLEKKSPGTARREDSGLKLWSKKYGKRDMLEIKNATLNEFAQWRKNEHKVSGRAIDLDVMALNHVFDFAREMEIIPREHPEFRWTTLATAPSKDELLSPSQMDELCNAALLDPATLELLDPRVRHLRMAQEITGQAFHDYLRLLQYAGGREHETCLQAWPNVTWSCVAESDGDGGQDFKKGDKIPGNLFFPGEDAKAGGGKPAEDRWVDFHPDLENHLKAMYERRDPSSDWMFPGRKEGEPVQRFNRQLERVKRELREHWKSGVPKSAWKKSQWFDRVTFQWFRHYFISHAVMAGIDYKTIAYWVSHRDGGILIGRLYGHLDKAHGRQMAAKLAVHLQSRR